eukprot:8454410-Pyramimonas_sp.AAC.1
MKEVPRWKTTVRVSLTESENHPWDFNDANHRYCCVLAIQNRTRIQFPELQHYESTKLLHPDSPASPQHTISRTFETSVDSKNACARR